MEIWKIIPNTKNCFSASSYGNIRSNKRFGIDGRIIKEKILKPGIHNNGYLKVVLTIDGKHYNKLVHRLVASCFLTNYSEDLQVNHLDGNKKNNNIKNLEMCTCSDNHKHAYKMGLMKITNNKRMAWKKTAIHNIEVQGHCIGMYSLDNKLLESFASKNAVYKKYGYYSTTITRAMQANRPAYGYRWKLL